MTVKIPEDLAGYITFIPVAVTVKALTYLQRLLHPSRRTARPSPGSACRWCPVVCWVSVLNLSQLVAEVKLMSIDVPKFSSTRLVGTANLGTPFRSPDTSLPSTPVSTTTGGSRRARTIRCLDQSHTSRPTAAAAILSRSLSRPTRTASAWSRTPTGVPFPLLVTAMKPLAGRSVLVLQSPIDHTANRVNRLPRIAGSSLMLATSTLLLLVTKAVKNGRRGARTIW